MSPDDTEKTKNSCFLNVFLSIFILCFGQVIQFSEVVCNKIGRYIMQTNRENSCCKMSFKKLKFKPLVQAG